MKKGIFLLVILFQFFVCNNVQVNAEVKNKADTELCDTLTFALINSLRKPIDQAVEEIYKNDVNVPENPTWAAFESKLIEIEQVYGTGGLYKITLKIFPYYRAHITYGEDIIVVNSEGELLSFEHIKTYPKIEWHE